MRQTIENAYHLLVLVIALALSTIVAAADSDRDASKRVEGVADLSLVAEGAEIRVELAMPALTVLGFAHLPGSDAERETLRLATENLYAGDGLVRFNTQARCRLDAVQVDTGFDPERLQGEGVRDMVASYRFACDQPDQLRSAAVGLFVGFPALERVLFRYVTPDGRGAAELTRSRPVVSFVPLL